MGVPTPISMAGTVVRDFLTYNALKAVLLQLLLGSEPSPNLVISKASHKAGRCMARLTISRQARLHEASRARSQTYKGAEHSKMRRLHAGNSRPKYIREKGVGRPLAARLPAAESTTYLVFLEYLLGVPLRIAAHESDDKGDLNQV